MIRATQVDDIGLLSGIERAADAAFFDVGMGEIAEGETTSTEDLEKYQIAGNAWVDTDDCDRPIAFLLVREIDDCVHLEQLSVHPTYAGQGKGRRLIEMAAEWAQQQGCNALTLTTFADVPWNAPYYARLGFCIVPPSQLTPDLRRIRVQEASNGLHQWPRVAMKLTLVG